MKRIPIFGLPALLVAIWTVGTLGTPPAAAQPAAPPDKFERLPWTMDEVRNTYDEGFTLIYSRSGTRKNGEEATGTHSFEITATSQWDASIDNVWEEGGERHIATDRLNWQDAVLLGAFPASRDTEFTVTGEETVTVPAGTFETVVVETTNSYLETRHTHWLVVDQPGVYAKWIDHGKEGEPAHLVMELTEIRAP